MQVRNNYELDVWNGDIGVIIGRDEEDDLVLVRFEDERQVAHDAEARDDLSWRMPSASTKAKAASTKPSWCHCTSSTFRFCDGIWSTPQ